jgi:hypothetical protein
MKMKTVLDFAVMVLPCAAAIGLPIWFRDDIYSTLVGAGVPRSLTSLCLGLLQQILALEIGTRWVLWLFSMKPFKLIALRPEQFKQLGRENLDRDTAELEQLGFVQLMDFTGPAAIGTGFEMRLFAHPEQCCFATVSGTKQSPTCCMSSLLEQDWELSVIRTSPRWMGSSLYGFHSQPRWLFKIGDQASPSTMFQTLLDWRSAVTSNLGIAPVPNRQAEEYFENEQKKRIKHLNTLVFKKSITWCILRLFWAMLIPQTEWLGDYKKYQGKRSR